VQLLLAYSEIIQPSARNLLFGDPAGLPATARPRFRGLQRVAVLWQDTGIRALRPDVREHADLTQPPLGFALFSRDFRGQHIRHGLMERLQLFRGHRFEFKLIHSRALFVPGDPDYA
jgi:hypothetical protein